MLDCAGTLQRRFRVSGIVQGVGFRPYVWHLAHALHVTGWVRNDAAGVEIVVQGQQSQLDVFAERLPKDIPPLARLSEVTWVDTPLAENFTHFRIVESGADQAATTMTMIGHDSAVCADCLAEMFAPADRRWRYAFINCTHCGPRYTLTRKLPYDRAQTSMAHFPLCAACASEYANPANRRFHAEPTACPVCGPRLSLLLADGRVLQEADPVVDPDAVDPIVAALEKMQAGGIVALKGLGGFHLACDARNATAVQLLRTRKNRDEKPFALMAANVASIAAWVEISAAEMALLQSPERPIVLLRKRATVQFPNSQFPDDVFTSLAPGLAWLGVMLPYTPMHWLLFHAAVGQPAGTEWMTQAQDLLLVMTSANPGGEPLVIDNEEAQQRLAGIADAVLLHDREIVVRCDDSVLRVHAEVAAETSHPLALPQPQFIRRARGYTPRAIRLPRSLSSSAGSVLALGGYLKNTVCVTRGAEAFVSQHIGGLDNAATCNMLMEVTSHLLDILQVKPVAIAHDLHPDFFSTRYALELAAAWHIPVIAVQHHHAHIAAVAAEHGQQQPLLGLALDGVGLGLDGSAWGGELLRLQGGDFIRLGHLAALPLPGGDKAAQAPWRMAAAVMHRLGRGEEIAQRFPTQPAAKQLHQLLLKNINCPLSSSLGRWFDAAAGVLGVRQNMAFEGQAAMLLEGMAAAYGQVEPLRDGYQINEINAALTTTETMLELDLLPLLAYLLMKHEAGEIEAAFGAALFHATLAFALADWTQRVARLQGVNTIALGGGCFLNHILSRDLNRYLTGQGFTVLSANQVPPNDAGLSLGQAWVAIQKIS